MGDSLVNGLAVAYLFDPDLIEVNWIERKSKFKNDVSPSNPGENIIMRPLCMTDYDSGYMELLSQLTKTGDVSREDFTARFHSMLKCPGTYYITVLEDTTTNRVIGSGTLLMEQKFIHNTSLRGRIEDIVVLDEYRGKQLGKLKDLSSTGYVTLYGADLDTWGLFDSYSDRGFRHRPFDHYMRAFSLFFEQSKRGLLCYRNKAKHQLLLSAIHKMYAAYPSTPKFIIINPTIMGHENLDTVSSTDDDFYEFFQLMSSVFRENTFLFVLSDHGIQMGEIQKTMIGQLEAKRPFLVLSYPEWLRNKAPNFEVNVRTNARERRAITSFDIYRTLVEILKQKWLQLEQLVNEKTYNKGVNTFYTIIKHEEQLAQQRLNDLNANYSVIGRSLFYPISTNRTCNELGLFDSFCECDLPVEISVKLSMVKQAARSVITHLNRLLALGDKCHKLSLYRINLFYFLPQSFDDIEQLTIVRQRNVSNSELNESEIKLAFELTITTMPNLGVFRSLLSGTVGPKNIYNSGNWEVIGETQRISKYGNESYCVSEQNRNIRSACYCLEFSPKDPKSSFDNL